MLYQGAFSSWGGNIPGIIDVNAFVSENLRRNRFRIMRNIYMTNILATMIFERDFNPQRTSTIQKCVCYSDSTCTYFKLVDRTERLKEAGQEFLVDIVV